MSAPIACPDAELLESWLLGRLSNDEAEPLEMHVLECPVCGRRADALPARDEFIDDLRVGSVATEMTEMPEVGRVIRRLTQLPRTDTPSSGTATAVPSLASEDGFLDPPQGPGEIGRIRAFSVVKVLGHGGMGVVYQAWQSRPRRLVALKAGRTRLRLARQHNEPEIVARLQHPHIIPVYEVGEHYGVPYFTMEFMEGGSLAQRLAAAALAPRDAAELVRTLASTVDYAHQQGVVHRDLKPSNVLLTRQGVPKIGDFGLAKELNPSGEPGAQTETGALLGTPSYMAPEQTQGGPDGSGPAVDIHALGAILYECLTGRPPYKAPSVVETIDQVRNGEPLAPSRLVPKLPRDLQTICLKCLQKDPRKRYATARDLADDLGRFLRGEPIVARATSALERAWKWTRRRPLVATLAGLCLASVIGLIVAAVLYEHRLRGELDNTDRALGLAQAEGARADANYREAGETVRRMLFRTGDPRYAAVPRLQELRRQQVEDALAFYERIAAQQSEDPAVQADVAWGCVEAGKLHLMLGRTTQGHASLRRAIDLTTLLAQDRPDDVRLKMLRADALVSYVGPQDDDALRLQEEGVALLTQLVQNHPTTLGARSQLADGLINLGAGYMLRGRFEEALPVLVRSVELSAILAGEESTDIARSRRLARARINLAAVHRQLKHSAEALEQQALAEAELEQLRTLDPHDRDTIDGLAVIRINGAYDFRAAGKPEEAVVYVRRNVPMLKEALEREPDDANFRLRLFQSHGVAGEVLLGLDRLRDAAEEWEQAALFRKPDHRREFGVQLTELWMQAGDHIRAAASAQRVREELEGKPSAELWNGLGDCYEKLATQAAADPKLAPSERQRLEQQHRQSAAAARKQAQSRPASPRQAEATSPQDRDSRRH